MRRLVSLEIRRESVYVWNIKKQANKRVLKLETRETLFCLYTKKSFEF